MSVFLITSSLVTTLLIPPEEFQPGGAANGRALAYLAHEYLGSTLRHASTTSSTIAILWFAGASAMAGLLNIVPRYLPRYGMAPQWARAVRPLVLVFTAVAFVVTSIFRADVDAQGGAYATGVLVLITSAAVAVTLAARRAGQRELTVAFGVIVAGLRLHHRRQHRRAARRRQDRRRLHRRHPHCVLGVPVRPRLRAARHRRHLRQNGAALHPRHARRTIRFIANEPDSRDRAEYSDKLRQISRDNDLSDPRTTSSSSRSPSPTRPNSSQPEGHRRSPTRPLSRPHPESSTVPNALAALLLHVRDRTGRLPHIYFEWTEGNPGSQPDPLLALRRRRSRPRHPRSPPPSRTRSGPQALRSCRMIERAERPYPPHGIRPVARVEIR